MAQRVNGALDALSEAMPKYPFIWGLTSRWFKGDKVWIVPLTADLLKTLCFVRGISAPYSWEVLQRFPKNKGEENLNDLHRYGQRRTDGVPLAQVLRRYSNVHVLIKFEAWINNHRQVTLYIVPQGPHGSRLRELCAVALKARRALHKAVETFQASADADSEAVLRRLAKKKKNRIDLASSLQVVREEGKVQLRRILVAAKLV